MCGLQYLSACETAVPGEKLADEIINLPVGFLYAGASGVIGSLWSVSDIGTFFVMTRFYWLLSQPSADPREAMVLSQLWIRDAKSSELLTFLRQVLERLEIEHLSERWKSVFTFLRRIPLEARPFWHPIYWAGFHLRRSLTPPNGAFKARRSLRAVSGHCFCREAMSRDRSLLLKQPKSAMQCTGRR